MIGRDDYRKKRLDLLLQYVDIARSEGLEFGAFDFPVVRAGEGKCVYADYRTKQELADQHGVDDASIVPITYLLDRNARIHRQIDKRFDYVILCHVIEHVLDVIGYLQDLAKIIKPDGLILLAIPDKRRTSDCARQSTSVYKLLERYYQRAALPSISEIMEFARSWVEDLAALEDRSPKDFFEWAINHYQSGNVDIHCNVWEDNEFFAQIEYLIKGDFINGLSVIRKVENDPAFNEFYMLLGGADFRAGSDRPGSGDN